MYNKKPKMILFDVGGTLFKDGKCIAEDGFSALLNVAENPDVTNEKELAEFWDEYMNEVCGGLKSKSGIALDAPLSAIIKYATMNTGLHINLSMPEQEELFDRFNSTRKVIDGVPELFKALEELNIRYAIISNNAMSGEGLALSIKKWLPSIKPEICLTSSDIMFTKPCRNIFLTALSYSRLNPEDCWYCGDSKIPDVGGAQAVGMTPVLIDEKSGIPLEFRKDGIKGEYMTVNNWNALKEYLEKI